MVIVDAEIDTVAMFEQMRFASLQYGTIDRQAERVVCE
jgi:hypothetical protein